ncbi:uncharacterized protein PHA67_018201 isoform 1-T1 [Liasis olivaceus]
MSEECQGCMPGIYTPDSQEGHPRHEGLKHAGVMWCQTEVHQPSTVQGLVGREVNLSCSHPTASTDQATIFWYQQFPNRAPQNFVSAYSGEVKSDDPKGTLYIAKSRTERSGEDLVSQLLPELFVQVGQEATLHCNFTTTSSNPDLFWYHQVPHQPPQHILTLNKYKPTSPGNISGTLSLSEKTSQLKIEKTSLGDRVVYFCALSPTVTLAA